MMKNTEDIPSGRLFEAFPPVPDGEWEEKIREDLQGADYDKKLMWDTGQGFKARPYYRKHDLRELDHLAGFPGFFPFVRGNKTGSNDWHIREDLRVTNFEEANTRALDILMKGVDSLGFILEEDREYTYQEIDALYKNIFAESIESNFICGRNSLSLTGIILELVRHYNRNLEKITGSVDFDPLGELMSTGHCTGGISESFDTARKLILKAQHLPHFQLICVHGDLFNQAGATIAEELGFSLSAGVEYLTQLTERGLSVNQVAPRLRFHFAVGPVYFLEIARLRAVRYLWAHIVKAYGPSDEAACRMYIHATTSRWNMTLYDPYVNMLRSATESMSAILGGIDSLTVEPFNRIIEADDPFATRIARNQQLLLKEESYLDKVVDPGAGSYYLEALTASLIEQAWQTFLQTEEKGGFLQAFLNGEIQGMIRDTAQKRQNAISTKKEILLGVNQYPDFREKIGTMLPEDKVFPEATVHTGRIAEPLPRLRGAAAFEKLRYRTDQYALKHERPRIFMLTYGNLAMRRARAQFACNFFACGGFEVIDNIGFGTLDEGILEARHSKPHAVVLCSSDDEYGEVTRGIVEELNSFSIAVVAGMPKDFQEQLQAYGVRYFIHVRANILDLLMEFQKEFGIERR